DTNAEGCAGRTRLLTEEVPAELDMQPGGVDLRNLCLDLVGGVPELTVGTIRQVQLRVSDPTVPGDLSRVLRSVGAHHLHARHRALHTSEEVFHRPLDVQVGHTRAALEDDLPAEAGARVETVTLEELLGLLALRPRERELVREHATGARARDAYDDQK